MEHESECDSNPCRCSWNKIKELKKRIREQKVKMFCDV